MLWYDDHAIGITRLNIFAGLFGAYLIREPAEDALGLPRGQYEIPLIIYDRDLDQNGQLAYPVSRDPTAPWVSKFVGNAILINGKLLPYLEVERLIVPFEASAGRYVLHCHVPEHEDNEMMRPYEIVDQQRNERTAKPG